MQKKIIIPLSVILLVTVSWFLTTSESSEVDELIVSPVIGEFEVNVTTTGELRAKNSKEIMGPQGVR
ncbi:MAG: RND transporter, partial [Balneolales bacterium]|nr:RND transporter [Balneolales bacterium]